MYSLIAGAALREKTCRSFVAGIPPFSQRLSHAEAQDTYGENRTLMGIYPAGDGEHLFFTLKSRSSQPKKAAGFFILYAFPANPGADGKIVS